MNLTKSDKSFFTSQWKFSSSAPLKKPQRFTRCTNFELRHEEKVKRFILMSFLSEVPVSQRKMSSLVVTHGELSILRIIMSTNPFSTWLFIHNQERNLFNVTFSCATAGGPVVVLRLSTPHAVLSLSSLRRPTLFDKKYLQRSHFT